MARELKRLMLREMEQTFHDVGQTGCVVVAYGSLSGEKAKQLRRRMREKGARLTVVKNSLFSLAMDHLGLTGISGLLDGPAAIVRAEDPVAAAKAARDAAAQYDSVKVRGGYAEGTLLDAAGVAKLADIPGRDGLLGMLAASVLSPARQLLSCVLAKPRELASCLGQLRDAKGQEPDRQDE
jgi:large subunit ribosomal protein L10